MSAKQNQVVVVARQTLRTLLGQNLSRGREIDHPPPQILQSLFLLPAQNPLIAPPDGGRHHQHPLSAAVGRIVHTVVFILGIVADIVNPHRNCAVFLRAPDDAL